MDMLQKQKLEDVIKANLLVSTGCTEPIAIAHASALARNVLDEEVLEIELKLSGNMIKNAMSVAIPCAKYVGAAFASALGALYADYTKKFKLLEDLTKEQHENAYEFSKKHVKIHVADVTNPIYIEVILKGKNNQRSRVIVEDSHTFIKKIERNGKAVNTNYFSDGSKKEILEDVNFSIKDVFEYVEELQDFDIFKRAVNLNMLLSNSGKEKDCGLNVGKMHPFSEKNISSNVVSTVAAAIDARMSGEKLPAMACTGSGNQGITATLSVYQLAKELNRSEEETYRAVAISILSTIYIKKHLNALSYLCGVVIASAGAAAGMTYLLGGDYKRAEYAIQNVISSVIGMFCDGAKNTCVLKAVASVSMAIYAANLAMTDDGYIKSTVGIIDKNLEKTLENIADIEKNTSKVMNETILRVITNS